MRLHGKDCFLKVWDPIKKEEALFPLSPPYELKTFLDFLTVFNLSKEEINALDTDPFKKDFLNHLYKKIKDRLESLNKKLPVYAHLEKDVYVLSLEDTSKVFTFTK